MKIFFEDSQGTAFLSGVDFETDWMGRTHYYSANFTRWESLAIETEDPQYWLKILDQIFLPCPFSGDRPINFQVKH